MRSPLVVVNLASAAGLVAGAAISLPTYSAITAGYTGANVDFPQTPSPLGLLPVLPPSATQIEAAQVTTPSAPPRVPTNSGFTSHGPYKGGKATTTGALSNAPKAQTIAPLGPNPTATYYNAQGVLLQQQPAPYTPAGGLGTNGTQPRYMVNSDFDFESIALGLYQEWIELDLFNNGLAIFSAADFERASLTVEDRALIAYMANQEQSHATLLTNMLGQAAPKQCTYNYPYTNVREFIDFNQKLTRWGESGVWGFINHLDSREVGQLLSQSIATEARQQMSFRQMLGLHAMPFHFAPGIPQSWAWTYLAPYISSCPQGQTRLAWQNFPVLRLENAGNPNRVAANNTARNETVGLRVSDPSKATIGDSESCVNLNVTGYGCGAAIHRNRTQPLSFPGKKIYLNWDAPGQAVGPNNSYITATSAGQPRYVAWVTQLNLTYTPLVTTMNASYSSYSGYGPSTTTNGSHSGYTYQPAGDVYVGDPAVNGTMFVALTDSNPYLTPFNLSMINPHVVALGIYTAG